MSAGWRSSSVADPWRLERIRRPVSSLELRKPLQEDADESTDDLAGKQPDPTNISGPVAGDVEQAAISGAVSVTRRARNLPAARAAGRRVSGAIRGAGPTGASRAFVDESRNR